MGETSLVADPTIALQGIRGGGWWWTAISPPPPGSMAPPTVVTGWSVTLLGAWLVALRTVNRNTR